MLSRVDPNESFLKVLPQQVSSSSHLLDGLPACMLACLPACAPAGPVDPEAFVKVLPQRVIHSSRCCCLRSIRRCYCFIVATTAGAVSPTV